MYCLITNELTLLSSDDCLARGIASEISNQFIHDDCLGYGQFKSIPNNILELDTKFASQIFDIQNAKRMIREAQKDKDEQMEDVYWDRLDVANRLADESKSKIQQIFNDTFGT